MANALIKRLSLWQGILLTWSHFWRTARSFATWRSRATRRSNVWSSRSTPSRFSLSLLRCSRPGPSRSSFSIRKYTSAYSHSHLFCKYDGVNNVKRVSNTYRPVNISQMKCVWTLIFLQKMVQILPKSG